MNLQQRISQHGNEVDVLKQAEKKTLSVKHFLEMLAAVSIKLIFDD